MKTVRTALFFLLVSLASPLLGQEAAYVSRLTAVPGGQSVLLTWKDAAGYPGAKYEVWRSAKEIVKETFAQAKLLATIDAGVEAYEDKTVTGPSFYLILLKDRNGNRKAFYIPYKNKTTAAVKPDGSVPLPTAQIKVGSISYASPQIVISFEATPADKKLLVLRRTSPIKSLADLKDSTQVGTTTGAASPYRDTPPPGLNFYYAVVDAQAFSDSRADTFQNTNATDRSAGFPLVALPKDVQDATLDPSLRPAVNAPARALPLPLLQVEVAPDSGIPLTPPAFEPVPAQLLPEATQAELRKVAKPATTEGEGLPEPLVLPEERAASEPGAAQYLVEIQKSYLQPKDWKGSIKALQTVLRLTLDDKTEARARFYLGEAWASLKNYRQAFVEILSARDQYPVETKPWLEALFNLLASVTD